MMKETNFNYHKVMVVDDAKIDRYIAEKVISKYSFAEEVVSVDSAKGARYYLSNHTANEEGLPDLIFLDINMPEMNGFGFLEEYKKLPENVKRKCIIVMLSSSLHPEDKELALQNPYVCQFLNKPLTEQKLQDVASI